MKINIVTVESGWILQKIAERIGRSNPEVFEVSHSPRVDVDANYYVDVQNCYFQKTSTLDIGYFTHLHENSEKSIQDDWLTLDYIIHKCTRYRQVFEKFYPAEKMSILYPGEISSEFKLKKPLIGIFQRGTYEGKGYFFMKKLAEYDILKKFKFLFVGSGWGDVAHLYRKNGIEAYYQENEDYSTYPKLYEHIDYLLIPSLWEGGPMSVIEACATGTPIISSDVGWVNLDFEVDHLYEPDNDQQLAKILEKIHAPIYNRRKKFSKINYKTYGEKLINIVERLK